jgi:glycosidase
MMDDIYRNYYEVFVYSFCDSDGDGIGDIQGLISKLDYINDGDPATDTDLGCTGIWLMPIMPSTTYHKYDVKNYKDIDPEYGTIEDFEQVFEGKLI